ncbi:MAG: DUF721 domain-containing protein [Opitutae bacterium]
MKRKSSKHISKELDLISNFMGLPSDRAETTSRQPLSMETLVEKVWEDWGIGEEETVESIISGNWQKIVGRNLSGKCAPVNLSKDGKTLLIRAASSTIKQDLSFRKLEILRKINSLKNCRTVTQLRIN